MKKLLLVALMAGGMTFAAAPRSDAQVFFSIGFGPGYYGGYYPYGYIIRTILITGRTMATPTTGPTIGTAATVTTATTVIIATITSIK